MRSKLFICCGGVFSKGIRRTAGSVYRELALNIKGDLLLFVFFLFFFLSFSGFIQVVVHVKGLENLKKVIACTYRNSSFPQKTLLLNASSALSPLICDFVTSYVTHLCLNRAFQTERGQTELQHRTV